MSEKSKKVVKLVIILAICAVAVAILVWKG
jgi:hypothetical protein